MRISRLYLFALIAFVAAAIPAWADVNPALIQHVGNTWYVTPANDLNIDGDNLTYVVDQASPGDTIFLESGTFWIGKPGAFVYYVTIPVPGNPTFSMSSPVQAVMVGKRLSFEGEVDADGNPLATITTNLGNVNGHIDTYAAGITFRSLRFYRMQMVIHTWVAGLTIDHCVFEESGQNRLLWPTIDLRTTYPHYVAPAGNPAADPSAQYDFSEPVKTYFTNNRIIKCPYGIAGFPSEMIVTGNDFDCSTRSIYITPGWYVPIMNGWPVKGGISQNNLIRDNTFRGQTVHAVNVCIAAYWTGIMRNNEVTHNTFTDVFHGAEFYAWSQYGPSIVSGNTVAHNRFSTDKGCTLVASYWPTHEKFLVTNNLFERVGRWAVVFWVTRDSAIVGNNLQNLELQWLTDNEAHITLDTCERTTVVGQSKNLVVTEIDGIDNIFVGVNNKKGAAKVGQRICTLMSAEELKGWSPGQYQEIP